MPIQPSRSLHVVVNRTMVPLVDSYWSHLVPPSKFAVPRKEVTTVRLNRPPSLFLGDASFRLLDKAILSAAEAVLHVLDDPLKQGLEEGHRILEVDVAWDEQHSTVRSRF